MGLLGALSHKIINWAVTTIATAIGLFLMLDIPWPNIPTVLLIVLVANIIGWLVASLLGFGSRG